MKRLVYSPYTQAYVRADSGVIDISPYITAGSVNRKVNQVSSAQLTLRNPVDASTGKLLWTDGPDGKGPVFHPMDPIIIVMTRLQGHPTQVFTGYIDKSPYYQMYPGLCTIEASCTLKRLLYTQFDSSLPFTQYFLEQFGWIPNGDTGIVNPTAESKKIIGEAGKLKGQFTDGSLGGLLYAVVNIIGQWDHATIWIEALPPEIKNIILNLYNQIQTEVQTADQQIESLITQIIGTAPQGGGNPNTVSGVGGSISGTTLTASQKAQAATLLSVGKALNAPQVALEAVICAALGESALGDNPKTYVNNGAINGGYWGVLQGSPSYFPDPHDTAAFATSFFNGGNGFGNGAAFTPGGAGPSGMGAIYWAQHGVTDPGQIAAIEEDSGSGASYYGSATNVAIARECIRNFTSDSGASPVTGNNPRGVSLASDPFGNSTSSPTQAGQSGRSPGGAQGQATTNASGKMTRIQAMIEAANALSAKNYPYVYGGGHGTCGVPSRGNSGGSLIGFDCSGSVSAVLGAAGLISSPVFTGNIVSAMGAYLKPGLDTSGNGVNIFNNNVSGNLDHMFMEIEGQYFGTWDGGTNPNTRGGPAWLTGNASLVTNPSFSHYHIPQTILSQTTTYNSPLGRADNTTPGGGGNGPGSSSGGPSGNSSMAAAFSSFLQLPGIFNSAEALALSGKRSFIADSPLFPFVEQICQASMRNFMSMPNGNFFAFFPDYFGLYGRQHYWEIHDIEIIEGRIDLTDDPLTTHVAVAGDVFYQGQVNVFDLMLTSGIFTILDAMTTGYVGETVDPGIVNTSNAKAKTNPKDRVAAATANQAALNFLQKYGCRPYVEENAAIRSPFFELFLSFQRWMVLWSKQFQTTFELTFMPELFPGGLVAFPEHGIQVYIEEVVHNFDYVNGFTTTVNVSSPSVLPGSSLARKNISEGVARPSLLQGQNSPRGVGTTPTAAGLG